MNTQQFELLVMAYSEIKLDDEQWEKSFELLEQIANTHTTNPELYEPIMKKHKVSY